MSSSTSALFPLPPVASGDSSTCTSSSSRVKRRGRDRAALACVTNQAIDVLNELYGDASGSASACLDPGVQSHLLHAAKRLRPNRRASGPPEPTGGKAFQALSKSASTEEGYRRVGKTKPTFLRKKDVARVAEPSDLNRIRMEDACSEDFLLGLRRDLQATPVSARKRTGRVFGTRGAYVEYLKLANRMELIGFLKASDVRAVNDLFFIEKVGKGTLRKIIDGRTSNPFLGRPGPTCMAGPWHSLEMQAESFWVGEADVEAAFTRVETIPELWGYQCLSPVRVCEVLGAQAQGGFACPFTGRRFLPGETAYPCYVRLTMGGVRSAEIMQHIGTRVLEAEFPDVPHFCRPVEERERVVLRDRPTGTAWGLYLDNLYVFGVSPEATASLLERGVAALTRAGLLCSITQPVGRTGKILGFWFDGAKGCAGVPAERMRLIREAGLWLARQDMVDVDAVECLLGHCAWAFLAQRSLYAVFHAIYEFVRLNRGRRVPWWASARRELERACLLVHLAVTDLGRGTAPVLLCTDAEGMNEVDLGGGAVVWRSLEAAEACAFRNGRSWETKPGDPPSHPLVSAMAGCWAEVEVRRWRYPAHNNLLEFEAVLLAAKAVARTPGLRGVFVPLVTDSSAVLGCMRKGRSSSYGMCCKSRKLAALSLAWGVCLFPRWVPTGLCAADSPSRRKRV